MDIVMKTSKSRLGDSYFNVLCDGNVKLINISSTALHTARGMYSTFVIPSDKCKGNFSIESVAYTELKNKSTSATVYQDVLLSTSSELYAKLCAFKQLLIRDLSTSIVKFYKENPESALSKYIDKHCTLDTVSDEINIMFLTCERNDKAYLHMKVLDSTVCHYNGEVVDHKYLMYKSFMTVPVVRLDNIRIPLSRNAQNRLNVHLVIHSQAVSPA